MLPKEHRLRRDRDFDRVFKKGKKVFLAPFSLRFVDNGRKVTRVAIVVGGSVSKKAVERNRVRRQLQEAVRPLLPGLSLGKDISISVQPPAKGMAYGALETTLQKICKKAGLL